MHILLKELSETNSSLEKIKILKKYEHDINIKNLFWWTLNPFKQFYIKKIEPMHAIGSKSIEKTIDKFIELLMSLSDRDISGNAAKKAIKELLEDCHLHVQDFYIRVLKKDLKCGTGSAIAEKVWGKFLPEFKVQLANKYDPNKAKNYHAPYFWASPKLDGIRCIYIHEANALFTRQGKPIIGFDHIVSELTVLCDNEALSSCDGELYTHNIPFQTLQEYIVKQKDFDPADKEKVKYNIFYIEDADQDKWEETSHMVDRLHKIFTSTIFEHLREVSYTKVNNTKTDIENIATIYVDQGYEGAMLRHPTIAYEDRRSNALLKFKFFQEADLKVISLKEGQGELAGTLGAIMVAGMLDKKSIVSDVGSGFTDNQRDIIWNDQKSYIGKIAEIKYQNITDVADVDGDFSLRFPVFLKFKEA